MLSLAGAACWLAPPASASGGPVIIADDVPTMVEADVPASFDATFADPSATVSSISWSFGDGTPSSGGAQTSHAWGAPGTYTVTVTAGDALGNVMTQTFQVTVLAPPTTDPPGSAPPPAGLTLTAAQSRERWNSTLGTVFTLSLNSRADVTLTFEKLRKGAHASAAQPLGTLRTSVAAGRRDIKFDGVISAHRKLAPGDYTVTLTASAGAAVSAPVTLDFTVQRTKAKKQPTRSTNARRSADRQARHP